MPVDQDLQDYVIENDLDVLLDSIDFNIPFGHETIRISLKRPLPKFFLILKMFSLSKRLKKIRVSRFIYLI